MVRCQFGSQGPHHHQKGPAPNRYEKMGWRSRKGGETRDTTATGGRKKWGRIFPGSYRQKRTNDRKQDQKKKKKKKKGALLLIGEEHRAVKHRNCTFEVKRQKDRTPGFCMGGGKSMKEGGPEKRKDGKPRENGVRLVAGRVSLVPRAHHAVRLPGRNTQGKPTVP